MNKMRTSQKGIDFIIQKEGVKLYPYLDIAGKMTIGIGHLIKPNETFESKISMQTAEQLLKDDLKSAENTINKYVKVEIDQEQFDALCSLCFNIGNNAFINSTLLKLLNQGDILKAANEFLRWIFVNKKKSPGLLARRKDEVTMFLS